YTFLGGSTLNASDQFKTNFAGFLPGETYTDRQLNAKLDAEANELFAAVQSAFSPANTVPGVTGYKIGSFSNSDVTLTWQDSFRDPTDGEVNTTGTGVPLGGFANELDADKSKLRDLLPSTVPISDAARQWFLAEALNQNVKNTTSVSVGINVPWDSGVTFAELVGKAVSHELGHTFGLNEAYTFDAQGYGIDVKPIDIMGTQDHTMTVITFRSENIDLLRAALGMHSNGDKPLTDALQLYKDNFNLPNSKVGLSVPPNPNDRSPKIDVKFGDYSLFFSDGVSTGPVAADGVGGANYTIDLVLINFGRGPLTIDSITLADGAQGFSILNGDIIKTSLAPGEETTLRLQFDPTMVGTFTDTLTISSNARFDPTFETKLNGIGISPTPLPEVNISRRSNNNFGGVPVEGETAHISEVVTITNQGAQPLTISGLRILEGEDAFTMTSSLENPVSLNFGESFTFGDFKFDPNIVGLDRAIVEILTNAPQNPRFSLVGTGLDKVVYPEWRNDFIAVEFPELPNPFELRTVSDNAGNFHFFLPVETRYGITIFDPVTGLVGDEGGNTPPTGGYINFTATMVFSGSYKQDSDGDGLPDDVEFAIGSSPNSLDTDKDGIDDFQEIQQGLDPLTDVGFPTGIIASLPLQGEAKAVVVEGNIGSESGQTAYVATGSHGLAIIDATKFNNPIVQGQLSLPGDATDVAVDTKLKIAAVATNRGGLQIVDISDPMVPTLIITINITANQVEIFDGIVYATAGTSLRAIDLLTGAELDNATLPGSGTVTGLARERTNLYAYISGSDTFSIIDITSPTENTILGQLNVRIASSEVGVFAANGVAYLAGSGMHTIDISDPNQPTLISDADFLFTARNVTGNGSGLALVASERLGLSIYDITNPKNTDTFLTQFRTPGFTRDVAIASGIAYVADDTGGLQVINYLPFDNKGVAPTITISSPVVDVDPDTEGVQVTEGRNIPIIAAVTDDVQVRNVELLVNGEVVSNDVSFPFELAAIALSNDPDATIVEVQARATDTGGNTALSNKLSFNLIPDTFAPVIESITPADGETAPFNTRRVEIQFNEALAETTVTAENFQLLNAEGEAITPTNIQLRSGDRTVQLTYSALSRREYSLVIKSAQITDRAGNPLGEEDVVSSFTVQGKAQLNLSDLDGSNGFVINGLRTFDHLGGSVSGAGDINGDGLDDLIIAASFARPNDIRRAGSTYVVFGSESEFDPSFDLSNLNGSNGFVINGVNGFDYSGSSARVAGDINGDGIDDLIIGSRGKTQTRPTYVVFGSDEGFDPSLELSDLDGNNGFVLSIDRNEVSGFSISGAGDINGDGIDDLIIGARHPGSSYVVFGSDSGFDASFNLSDLNGSNGFILNGIDSSGNSGSSVSGAGDINGDGIDDLIIGTAFANPNGNQAAGSSYVVFGSNSGFNASFNLSDLNGNNGFVLNGIDSRDNSGGSVSGAGDINGDGIDDIIIGAPGADPNGIDRAGETYVVFGSDSGFDASFNLSDLNGNNGFVLLGIDSVDASGESVSGAGDINGDGIDDIIIGAPLADPNAYRSGEIYVVLGSDEEFAASFNLSNIDGSNGFVLNGVGHRHDVGSAFSGAGDINGDGIDDLIIGAASADPNGKSSAGTAYVVFGVLF
ncbi:MAG: FG-GAP repeat protein, partial [Prochloron sp. SP5CPC1]|nr:FG-GAP repeat protein [Candidatus Paraprochloron terpiosi SP5CPC1]